LRNARWLSSLAAAGACLALAAAPAPADPGEGHADDIPVPPPSLPVAAPGAEGLQLLDVADKDGTLNSDIAFYGDYAYVGNYDGFRIIDISRPARLRVVSDLRCRANQGDVSVFKARNGRMYLLQSIDRPVTAPDCTAVDTPTVQEDERGATVTRARFGYEGLRLFDVTDPTNPAFVRFIRTECGSHTHTLVPGRGGAAMFAYVASYPLGSQITPQVDVATAGSLTCDAPHAKISIVRLPTADPAAATVRTKALSADTELYDPDGPFHPADAHAPLSGTAPAFAACHDHQAFLPRDIMVASCAGDLQYWSNERRGDPTSADGEDHTHVQREVRTDDPATTTVDERWESFDFVHSATVSWDGEVVTMQDESGGGVEARCDGPNTKRGWTFLYPLVEPGDEVDGFADLLGRFVVPRPQGSEICVSHNGNVLPTADDYWQAQAFYQAGTSVWDFTNVRSPAEFAWADLETPLGRADSWSSYWYNDVVYTNGGLARGATGTANRGFEAYALHDADGDRIRLRRWRWLNPQTQERRQVPVAGRLDGS
jgi:hypothetical protein